MKVVVFGASGYLGGAIARHWQRQGATVHTTARSAEGRAQLESQGLVVFDGHLGEPAKLAEAAAGCRYAVHAAGTRDRNTSRKILGWTHVAGTDNVIAACQHAAIRHLVHISCADVTLQAAPRIHWNEDRVLSKAPFDAHAETMGRAEEAVIGAGTSSMTTNVLRPAFVWGPGGDGPGDLGTATDLCREGLAQGLPLFGPGDRFVSATYIGHVARASELAATAEGAAGSVFHLVDGELNLAREFFGGLSEALGLPVPRKGVGIGPSRLAAWFKRRLGGEAPSAAHILRRAQSHTFSAERAREQLGFEPGMVAADGLVALRAWAESHGGAAALAAKVRHTPE